MSTYWIQRSMGVKNLKPSSVSTMYKPKYFMTIPRKQWSNVLLQNLSKYNISTSTTELYQQQQNIADIHIHVYKKVGNYILYLTFYPSYMWIYTLLAWVCTSNCLYKYSHGVHYGYEFAFETIPKLVQFTHYTLCYPVYYYYAEMNFPRTNYQPGHWLIFHHYWTLINNLINKSVLELRGLS